VIPAGILPVQICHYYAIRGAIMMRGIILCACAALVSATRAAAGDKEECPKADPVLQFAQPDMPSREKADKQRRAEDCRKTKRIILM